MFVFEILSLLSVDVDRLFLDYTYATLDKNKSSELIIFCFNFRLYIESKNTSLSITG